MVPLSATTIYEMEQRGEFPKRFYLTPRCAAWDLDEVNEWLEQRISITQGVNEVKPIVARNRKQLRLMSLGVSNWKMVVSPQSEKLQ